MPISSMHPCYLERKSQWERCRDAYEGQDAIKGKGRKYLPMLTKQKLTDYQAYKSRALFFSITAKTVSALVGMAMLRTPAISFPPEMDSYFKEDQGIQFYEILATTLAETLLMGRVGILIDRPRIGGKPVPRKYYTENILNWDDDEQGRLNWVVLQESVSEAGRDRYDKKQSVRYRLLEILNGVYTVSIYDQRGELVEGPMVPTNSGQSMDYIPFFIVNPFGLSTAVEKPPMLEIVDINISHYCTSADLEHGRHFTALPTPVVSGASATTELYVGSQKAWVLPESTAKASYLEFTGQGLGSLEKALEEKQGQLASLSAQLLDNSKRGSESPDTVRLRYASETASLAMVVRSVEALLMKVYSTIASMESLDPTSVRIVMNKEFLDSRMSAKDVLNLVQSYLDGGITEETLLYNLRRGDVIDVNRSDDEEIKALQQMRDVRMAALAKNSLPSGSMTN
jgi:hypothetical protein